ncbi:MAG: FkbM family methyltransferase [Bradyrhizobium sp.]|uniref:FkbM family methyltransferase n=1 Tax=Bradyrhizobium sp. TaxID=376 RepID=UPI0025B8BFEF|nr:FkbM family methyltransferase [Bradyrhizobium sp.]MBI5260643.1 FkbM family methyltransferase [Bradyrhizobium sp.]
MGIGAQSPRYRRALYRLFESRYFRRRARTDDGVFQAYVSPSSSLSVLDVRKSLVDPVHERFIREWVGVDDVVWDIGANLGLFALPAALKVRRGRVYAFEPDLELAWNLIRSLRLRQNRNLKLSAISVAISSEDAAAAFQISRFSRALNKLESVGKWRDAFVVPEETRWVPTMRIDTLARSLAAPTVLKIDVEGGEMGVLHGGAQTIATIRPNILIECASELQDPMAAFFETHRYVLLDGEAEARSPLQRPVWNTIAIPNEKIAAARL